jgi:hypothetical protein
MTTEAAKCFTEINPGVLYIQITAWATVALVIATIGMVVWQIVSMRKATKVRLSMQFMDQYQSAQMRANRQSLASLLSAKKTPSARAMEPILDVLEAIANLHQRKWLDTGLIENAFSIPIRYWWRALESHITTMRSDYHDGKIYREFQELARQYSEAELTKRQVPAISDDDLRVFLTTEEK